MHAEALEEVEPFGEPQHEGDPGRVVVLARSGGGEGDVEQQRHVEDQGHGGQELESGEGGAAHAAHAQNAAREQEEKRPEHRPQGPGARRAAVVVRHEQQRAGLLALAPGDHVLRGAPPEQPPRGGRDAGEVEEGEHGGEHHEPGAELRARDRDHAADDRDDRVDRVAHRPGRPHRERLDHDLPPKSLEPLGKMPSRPPLGIRPSGPRPDAVDERLGLSEGVDPSCPGWDSNPHALSDNRF